ncbi:MAG: tRNA lysidine(34) synthetase TilS [Fimbriimonadaceae bacterium]|nr:tRNA lysidine(34) synthetase TilS [Chthonomonadaceae bacterium]MCO5295967.1 tRNA lysidine(34) synthetase TilS [Fimbriimonadaceae bacterium]
MLERFRAHLESSQLIAPEDLVLVGYSGGPDSTCLLDLLVALGVPVVAAHLHHGQREEAKREMERCQAFCAELGVPFYPGRADVPAIAKRQGIGLEEAGRNARYEFFRQVQGLAHTTLVATAHTRDDLLETVLLNLSRGTGLRGLAGIPEARDGIVRPLLKFTRAETRAYCEAKGLWTHDDPSNEDLAFARARVRHRVLPELRLCHPGCDEAIERMARLAAEEDALLDSMAAAALERCELEPNGPLRFVAQDAEVVLDRMRLAHVPRPLLRRAVRLAGAVVGGTFAYEHVAQVLEGLGHETLGSVTAEDGAAVAEWDEATLRVASTREPMAARATLATPGETASETFGWRFAIDRGPVEVDPLTACFDPGKVRGELHVRPARPGDAIECGEGKKKVKDLFSAAKLSKSARRLLPIVCDFVGPVWIPGLRVSTRVRADARAQDALRIRFGPLLGPSSHN